MITLDDWLARILPAFLRPAPAPAEIARTC